MKNLKRILAVLLVFATLLSLCSCELLRDLIENFTENPDKPQDTETDETPYDGHYLTDLYKPYNATRDKYDPDRFSSYVSLKEDLSMAYEEFHKGIRFDAAPNDGNDLFFDFDIGGKYENISFFYGMDMSTPWQADNVAFQIINPDTDEIVWEDLFEIGDIPRFVTVNIKGMQKIRLECYILGGGSYCMADITLWEGKSEAVDRSYPKITEPTMLEDNYKFYYSHESYTLATSYPVRNFGESAKPLSIKGEQFKHAAIINFGDSAFHTEIGDDLYMNLRGQFKQISFYFGLADNQPNSVYDGFKGYVSIYADGRCVLDEYICTTETPAQTITLDVDYAWQLRIVTRSNTSYNGLYCLAKLQGGENLGSGTESGNKNSPVPMIRTYPPYFISESTRARAKVFDFSSRYQFFSMGGENFCEGIVLQPVWDMLSDFCDPAYVICDLEGEQKYLTFTMGHVDTSPYKDGTVNIYLNDEETPSYSFAVGDTDLPKKYTIDVKNCRTIKFLCTSETANNLPTIGIANIVAYPEEVVENDIFKPYHKEYPEECEIFDYFKPFGYSVACLDKPYYVDDVKDDGMTFTTCDDVKHKKGLLFCTKYGFDWDYVGFLGIAAAFMGGVPGMHAYMNGGQTTYTNSFYIFNVGGQYSTLTFKTAKVTDIATENLPTYIHAADPECTGYSQTIKIYGDSDEASIYSCDLIDGTVQEHTVDISGMERIIFCIPNNEHLVSEVYSAFDIQLSGK